jgi:AcrR family transcriptional regulator
MSQERSIKAAAAYAGMTTADIARALDVTTATFSQRLTGRGFREDELDRIAEIMGAKYDARFEFSDGTRV